MIYLCMGLLLYGFDIYDISSDASAKLKLSSLTRAPAILVPAPESELIHFILFMLLCTLMPGECVS